MTKVTWHNVLLGGAVWSLRRGHWQPAVVIGRGRATCRVKFIDTGNSLGGDTKNSQADASPSTAATDRR